ncbi:MAG: hypothetical protein KF757_14135 [Phycisphaeraceae bacterium]|nr:hypothetical protein [Phycisphaeraceae bacterium]MCW5763614.1 hypothetical protein [Phycisphaeraceae bacterium]
MTPISATAVRALAVLAWMAAHACAQEGSIASGSAGVRNKQFFIAQESEGARLNIGGYLQFRYHLNWRDDDAGGNDFTNGFMARRSRVQLSGQIMENWTFNVMTELSPSGAGTLLDGFIGHRLESGWVLQFGQFKMPLLREELVSDAILLAAERSPTNSVFSQSRSLGVQASRESEDWRGAIAIHNGMNTLNTRFDAASAADFAVTGRLDHKLAGAWSQFRDFTSWRGSDFAAMIGAAGHYQTGGETGNTTDLDFAQYTLDLSLEGDGWNAFAAFIGRHSDTASGSFDDFGVVVQGGVFVSDAVELWGRYDIVIADDDRPGVTHDFGTITAGLNWYVIPESHAVVVKVQAMWYLDAQAGSLVGTSTGSGLLASPNDDQFSIFAQIGMIF